MCDLCEPHEIFLGKLARVAALGFVFIAFPVQIFKNWEIGQCSWSIIFIGLAFSTFFTRLLLGLAKKMKDLVVPDVCGAIFVFIIFLQWLYYHWKKIEGFVDLLFS